MAKNNIVLKPSFKVEKGSILIVEVNNEICNSKNNNFIKISKRNLPY